MKNIYLLAVMMLSAMAVTFTSCGDEEDIFDRSAALRLNDAQKNLQNTLCADGGKWEFQYFANGSEEGYVFVMTFHPDGTVDISTKNSWQTTFATESSSWEVLTDYGIDLSFISYNSLLHRFSDPTADLGTYNAGEGHLGDYEFLAMSVTDNDIILKGKKRGITHRLRRLPADTNDEEYFTRLDAAKKAMFNVLMPDQLLTLNDGSRYIISNGYSSIMSFLPEGGDPVSQTESRNLLVFADGIRFMDPFTNADGSIAVQTFMIQEDGSLLCSDDNESTITSLELSTLFADQTKKWRMDKTTLGGQVATVYSAVVEGCKLRPIKKNFTHFQFQASGEEDQAPYSLFFKDQNSEGNFYMNETTEGANKVKFAFTGNCDENAQIHLTNVSAFQDMMDLLAKGSWTLSAESALLPMRILVTSDADPNNSFYVDLQK